MVTVPVSVLLGDDAEKIAAQWDRTPEYAKWVTFMILTEQCRDARIRVQVLERHNAELLMQLETACAEITKLRGE